MSTPVLPVARFSPAPGLSVTRTGNWVVIRGTMELYGPEATPTRAQSVQNAINTMWTKNFNGGYAVTCNVIVRYRAAGVKAGDATQIEADKAAGPSHVWPGPGDRYMFLNANNPSAFTWTAAHEFGHIIGMDDRYTEGILSKISGTFGGQRTTTIQSGYSTNLMGVHGGVLEPQNLIDLASENEPSPLWTNDDNYVRDWVGLLPLAAITSLSTADKLKIIHVLMGGYISDGDMEAIKKICGSVTSGTEGDMIRGGVDPLQFTSIGQRTEVRIALGKMPRPHSTPVSGSSASSASASKITPVGAGDTLSGLAKSAYGDYELWPLIWDTNRGAIGPNPNRLKIGTRLLIPPLGSFSADQITSAKRRAPSWRG